jgi:methyltransferase, FkbM family
MDLKYFFNDFFFSLSSNHQLHSCKENFYTIADKKIRNIINNSQLRAGGNGEIDFGSLNKLIFPFHQMGSINSLHLFGLDEMIIFSYYIKNKHKYFKVADIGANIGLHSIIMAKCGWQVNAFEPDPLHCNILLRNLAYNKISNQVNLNKTAISSKSGRSNFTRVLGKYNRESFDRILVKCLRRNYKIFKLMLKSINQNN